MEVLAFRPFYRRVNVPEFFGRGGDCITHIDHGQGCIFVSTLVEPTKAEWAYRLATARAIAEAENMSGVRPVPFVGKVT